MKIGNQLCPRCGDRPREAYQSGNGRRKLRDYCLECDRLITRVAMRKSRSIKRYEHQILGMK